MSTGAGQAGDGPGEGWPQLSVVTVSFRDLSGLKKTRESVLALEYPGRVQQVVIDGGSGPEVEAWLSEQTGDLRWVSEPDGGIYDAMNKGIAIADGDVVWFMNSADRFHSTDSATRALAGFTDGRAGWGFGRSVWHLPGSAAVHSYHGPRRFYRSLHLLGRQTVPHQASFFGADLLAEVGGYRSDVYISADQVLMMECALKRRPHVVPEVLCDFDMTGISTARTRGQHWEVMRSGRRAAGVSLTGSQHLDDAISRTLERLEHLLRRTRHGRQSPTAEEVARPLTGTEQGA